MRSARRIFRADSAGYSRSSQTLGRHAPIDDDEVIIDELRHDNYDRDYFDSRTSAGHRSVDDIFDDEHLDEFDDVIRSRESRQPSQINTVQVAKVIKEVDRELQETREKVSYQTLVAAHLVGATHEERT